MTRRDGDRRHARGSEARARRRQSQRRAQCPRIPLEPDSAVRRRRSRWRKAPGAFYRLRPQRREVRPGASALLDGENLDLMVAHQDDIAAALPIGARAFAQARQNPRGMPADYTFRSQFRVSMLSPLQRRRISARIVEPGPAPTLIAW